MVGTSVENRLKNLKSRIFESCRKAGRAPGSVHVLAVSKFHTLEKIRSAYEAGQLDFAENYLQEAAEKMEQLGSLELRWHFIGRIQSNKVKFLGAHRFAVIHSVDRRAVAEHLDRLSGGDRRQDIFVQFNVAGEKSKAGLSGEAELKDLVRFIVTHCEHLRVLGLMVMPPLHEGQAAAREYFRRAREILGEIRDEAGEQIRLVHPLNQLSMGTSHDFEEAIAEGATWVRIGTEIFGARPGGELK